jgi:hypothetical protein
MIEAASQRPILVFLGPTLPLVDAAAILDCTFLPPAAQGDVLLAAHAFRPRAMVLIDGQFEDRPAVRHKEILWAMAHGIIMVGAASMGALRAAELSKFGMIGVGLIYRWYRRWPLAPDDAVAVHSAPPELGFLPLTDSMIDLQLTFSSLMRRNLITPKERNRMTSIARGINFRDRSIEKIIGEAGLKVDGLSEIRKHVVRQKRFDALLSLQKINYLIEGYDNLIIEYKQIITNTFLRDLDGSGIDKDLLTTYK